MEIPAWCPRCNRMFTPKGGIFIEGGAENLTLRNSRVTCPECGGWADFIEGTFNIRDGIIEVVQGTKWTRQKLREYQKGLTAAAEAAKKNPAEAISQLYQLDPEIGALVASAMVKQPTWSVYNVIMLVIAALSFLATTVGATVSVMSYLDSKQPVAGTVTVEQLKQAIDDAVSEAIEDRGHGNDGGGTEPVAPPETGSNQPPAGQFPQGTSEMPR